MKGLLHFALIRRGRLSFHEESLGHLRLEHPVRHDDLVLRLILHTLFLIIQDVIFGYFKLIELVSVPLDELLEDADRRCVMPCLLQVFDGLRHERLLLPQCLLD